MAGDPQGLMHPTTMCALGPWGQDSCKSSDSRMSCQGFEGRANSPEVFKDHQGA